MKNVLIVEDEIELAAVLVDLLEEYGHNVEKTYSGNNAISLVAEKGFNHFDTIISDVNMDDGDGILLYTALQKMKKPYSEFIFFTSYGDVIPEVILQDNEAKVLEKPLDIDLLIEMLE